VQFGIAKYTMLEERGREGRRESSKGFGRKLVMK
jgi:hypothetical protein